MTLAMMCPTTNISVDFQKDNSRDWHIILKEIQEDLEILRLSVKGNVTPKFLYYIYYNKIFSIILSSHI